MSSFSIVDIDYSNHVAYSDHGHIFEVESYVDVNDDPCLPEEACAVYVRVSSTQFHRYDLEGEDEWYQSE